MDGNISHKYGTWDTLVRSGYIQQGYNRTNMIDNYSICVFETGRLSKKRTSSRTNSTFTIIAVPRSQNYNLRTFGISDEQTPKVWVGTQSEFSARLHNIPPTFSLDNANLWEPLR